VADHSERHDADNIHGYPECIDRDATVTAGDIRTELCAVSGLFGKLLPCFRHALVDEESVLAADPAATGEVVTIGGGRYVVRADNVHVPATVYFDPQTVTAEAGSVVTYDGQARAIEHNDADGVQLACRADDLAAGIAWILDDSERREQLGRQALARAVNEYAIQMVAGQYHTSYKDSLD